MRILQGVDCTKLHLGFILSGVRIQIADLALYVNTQAKEDSIVKAPPSTRYIGHMFHQSPPPSCFLGPLVDNGRRI